MSGKYKVLIAYDGSECAENSVKNLSKAGLPREAEALIVQVNERWLPPPSSYEFVEKIFSSNEPTAVTTVRVREEPETEKIDKESPMLLEAYQKLKTYFPEWKIETVSLHGSPSYEITRKAKDWNADLVVVGSEGNARNKLSSLGSVSQKIANESPCSVRVVRGNSWKKGSPSRILIGLDGTLSAQMAVEEVARRMWIMGSEVRLVTAKDSSKNKPESKEQTAQTDVWINYFIEKAKLALKTSALGVSQIIEEGDPKQIIVRAADEWGADCIFIGSNDTGNFFENLLLGSVATAVVARAHCTVEVVRHQQK